MALAFPTNPTVGQTHTDGTRSWKWTGARWQSVQASPLAHAASHATGGADAISPADIGAATSAQGAKADSASQPGHAHVIGDVTGLQAALGGVATLQTADPDATASAIFPNGMICLFSGTTNGKPLYTADDGVGGVYVWTIFWNGTQWVAQEAYGGDGSYVTNYLSAGNTTYPWQANWSNAGVPFGFPINGIAVTRSAVVPSADLGGSTAGVATTASRSDHKHAMPTKWQIGLGNCDNTSDLNKPISTYTQTALNAKAANSIIQIFTASGTWTKPTGAKVVDIQCVGGGNGGGCGAKVAASTAVYGGLGGSSGGYSRQSFDATQLSDASYTVTIGAAGTGAIYGGAAATVGGASSVSGTIDGRITGVAIGGSTSNGGTTAPVLTYAGIPQGNMAQGAQINANGGNAGVSYHSAPAGGTGGGVSATGTAYAGGTSTNVWQQVGATPGAAGGGNGSAVTAKAISSSLFNGTGGSGGGGSATSNGGNGGSATCYGAGGGGGGSVSSASALVAGNGGNGKSGVVIITTFF